MQDPAELHRILVEWNGVDAGCPPYCIHELIEQQTERTPDTIALIFGDTRLTYRELNDRANQLAHFLRRRGVGPEIPVGVLMDASPDIIVTVLAILKAGGAYLSLDHYQPPNRLREVVREAQLGMAVTTSANAGYLAISDEIGFVCLDLAGSQIAGESAANPRAGVTPDNMAFVRYTSGATGKPKGAVSIHRSITSRLMSAPLPDFVPTDVCLVNTAWGFGSKLFYPLTMGATVVVVPEDHVRDATRLADSLEHYGITTIFMVPSHLRQLLSLGDTLTRRLGRLRNVTTGGEILTADLAARFRELLPQAQLINSYGGTEVGGTATLQLIDKDSLAEGSSIGRPVVNTRVYLLDDEMQPVPPGVTAEIYVGSGHMGRGYLNRPDLTEPRFVADPFGASNGGVLYRTGDLGRHYSDGRIEFLGRADRQVKVRGFRVEPEEIEAALHDHRQILQAALTTIKAGDSHRLIAYVVPRTGERPGVSALKSFLRERLPEYMVPHAFVFLDRMPLNRHGKVDLEALPPPATTRPDLASAYEAPRNSAESAVADIWSELLGVDAVGIHDNFIELGGDSLLATAASARMMRRLGIELPMPLVLEWSIATIVLETAPAGDDVKSDEQPGQA